MHSDTYQHLISLCDALASHTNVSHWRVAFRVRGDGQFFSRLRKGGGCTAKTAARTLQWFSDHWPTDLEWPRDIPRPPKSEEAA
ncbi:MAG: hypothetical protein WCZ72_08170 [Gemmobacter sp.]